MEGRWKSTEPLQKMPERGKETFRRTSAWGKGGQQEAGRINTAGTDFGEGEEDGTSEKVWRSIQRA